MKSLDLFTMAYTALGGLGVFFLGLNFLTTSLQEIAGELIRRIINFATTNRFLAVLVGVSVTAIIQSSSICTVMVVGLVNAGLMDLLQAIGVILGANIGTTITGWIFAVKVGKYGLLLIGVGIFPMLFSKRERFASIAKVVVALGLIFLGLQMMGGAFKPLRSNEAFLSYLQMFDAGTTSGLLGGVVIGCILTLIVQSSSAMLGITIAMALSGTLTFPTAAALVLGENIGTTITALLAAIGGTIPAKRAALSHALFNVIGVGIMLTIFPYYLELVDAIVPGNPDMLDAAGEKPNIAAHIAMGHSLFNVTATIIVVPFLGYLARLVVFLLPDDNESKQPALPLGGIAGTVAPEVALDMAHRELNRLSVCVRELMTRTREYLGQNGVGSSRLEQIRGLEEESDRLRSDLITFVTTVAQGSLTAQQAGGAYGIMRAADEIEILADYCRSLCYYRQRMNDRAIELSEPAWSDIIKYFSFLESLFDEVTHAGDQSHASVGEVSAAYTQLSEFSDILRENHVGRLKQGICKPLSAVAFTDITSKMRRLRNHIMNLYHAMSGSDWHEVVAQQ